MKKLTVQGQENLDNLVSLLEERLSSTPAPSDQFGNRLKEKFFSAQSLETFLQLSLSEFNATPYFSMFTFEDTDLINLMSDVLVEGATITALASRSLIEKGREFEIQDNGISFNPPSVSDVMQTQYSTLLSYHMEKLRSIKSQLKDLADILSKK